MKNKRQYRKALFIDLDGTIIEVKSGKKFPKDLKDWQFKPDILPRLKEAHEEGYLIAIVSNQAGIEKRNVTGNKKYPSSIEIDLKLNEIVHQICSYIKMDNVPHNIVTSYCGYSDSYFRKPNPGMAYHIALEHGVLIHESIMVGDASGNPGDFSDSDLQFANNINVKKYLDVKQFLEYGIKGYS